jgi:hypothetical protein
LRDGEKDNEVRETGKTLRREIFLLRRRREEGKGRG